MGSARVWQLKEVQSCCTFSLLNSSDVEKPVGWPNNELNDARGVQLIVLRLEGAQSSSSSSRMDSCRRKCPADPLPCSIQGFFGTSPHFVLTLYRPRYAGEGLREVALLQGFASITRCAIHTRVCVRSLFAHDCNDYPSDSPLIGHPQAMPFLSIFSIFPVAPGETVRVINHHTRSPHPAPCFRMSARRWDSGFQSLLCLQDFESC
jgi:hypothetical protein